MPRGVIDIKGIQSPEMQSLKNKTPPEDLPFNITKIGHVVLRCQDINKSVEFYTQVLGFRVSDVYPDSMVDGKMVFMRCNSDHHGVALVGGVKESSRNIEMHHMAFEVDDLDQRREKIKAFGGSDYGEKVTLDISGAGKLTLIYMTDPEGNIIELQKWH